MNDERGELVGDNYNLGAEIATPIPQLSDLGITRDYEPAPGPLSKLWESSEAADASEIAWRREAERRLAKVLRDINGGNLPGYGGQ